MQTKIKYTTYKVDTLNRNENILEEEYFVVLTKLCWLDYQDALMVPQYRGPLDLIVGKPVITHYFINKLNEFQIVNEDKNEKFSIYDKVISPSNTQVKLFCTPDVARREIDERYNFYMNDTPYKTKCYIISEE